MPEVAETVDVRALIAEVVRKVTPKLKEESKKHGIPEFYFPAIVSDDDITVAGKTFMGLHERGGIIHLNAKYFEDMLKWHYPKTKKQVVHEIVVHKIAKTIFHEFKHELDDRVDKVTIQEYKRDKTRFENEAEVYAEKMCKQIGV